MCYTLLNAFDNWDKFVEVFNKNVKFAPYSIPLSREIIDSAIIPACDADDYIMIGSDGVKDGIIHSTIYHLEDGNITGIICLLFADDNNLAEYLLEQAEIWFAARKVKKVLAYSYHKNPYKFILHGYEPYAWGGAYPVINAFRRLKYDLALDVIVMNLDLTKETYNTHFNIPGIDVHERVLVNNNLAWGSNISLTKNGKLIADSSYYWLKATSERLKRNYGQITIGSNDDIHGDGTSRALLELVHGKMAEIGIQRVILATNQSLFRAVKFYEKLGYKAETIRGFTYEKDI